MVYLYSSDNVIIATMWIALVRTWKQFRLMAVLCPLFKFFSDVSNMPWQYGKFLSFLYHSQSPTDVCALHVPTLCAQTSYLQWPLPRSLQNWTPHSLLMCFSWQCLWGQWANIIPFLQMEHIRFLNKHSGSNFFPSKYSCSTWICCPMSSSH